MSSLELRGNLISSVALRATPAAYGKEGGTRKRKGGWLASAGGGYTITAEEKHPVSVVC